MAKILTHPLISAKLTIMRDKNTKQKEFRENLDEIGALMTYEVLSDLETEEVSIETPVTATTGVKIKDDIVIVPILRAGLGMVNGIYNLVPNAKIAHIGLARNEETLMPEEYYANFPKNLPNKNILVVDPMLATGGSAIAAVDKIKERGANKIKFICLVAAPEGVKALEDAHPDVDIYVAALDDKLNEKGYITPGLGDAGDRLFGTL
jgi:uracil phosphoribosyltransferase